MPQVRSEYDFIRSAEISAEEIVIYAIDICGRLGADGQAITTNASEPVQFIYAESGDVGDSLNVIWTRRGGRMALRVFDDVAKGDKLRSDNNGRIVQSGTGVNAIPAVGDFAIAMDSGTAGDFVECVLTGE